MYLSETQDYVMKLYQIFHVTVGIQIEKVFFKRHNTKRHANFKKLLRSLLYRASDSVQCDSNSGGGGGVQNLPKDFCSVLKVEELSI